MEKLIAPAVGHVWPGQGGIFVGLHPLGGYLIAATEDVAAAEYGNYGVRVAGADSFIDGAGNTTALLADSDAHLAAKTATAYTADGHTDFFLPSQRELVLGYASAPESFSTNGYYWSSTQCGPTSAWAVVFECGRVDLWGKHNEFRVRPFRRSSI